VETKKIYCQILCVLLLGSVLSYGSKAIEGFSVPSEIHSATIYQNHLFLATDGGIRFYSGDNQSIVYTADDGLEATTYYSIASNEQSLYAVSANGLIVKQSALGGPFKVINRSFISGNAQVLKGLIHLEDSVLVLAFNDKLAFVDLISERSLISLTSIASHRLKTEIITALTVKEDSLYVAINNKVYVRKMKWSNMEEDLFLADPSTWNEYPITLPPDTIRAMAWLNDSLVVGSEKGTLYYNEKGQKTEASLNQASITIEDKELNDSLLFKNDSSLVEWVLKTENGVYFIGPSTVIYREGAKMADVSAWNLYTLGPAHQIIALNTGGIFAASPYGDFSLSDGYTWTPKQQINFTPYKFEFESVIQKMKSISIDNDGNLLYGLWGGGFILYKNTGLEFKKYISPSTTCIDEFLDDYIVTIGSTPAPDQSGFFVSYWSSSNYGFAYIDLEGEVSCANGVGSSSYPGPLQVIASPEDPDQWVLYSSAGNVSDVGGSGSLDVFSFTKPSKTGGRLVDVELKTYDGPNKERIVDMDFDPSGRLWVAGHTSLGYLDSEDDEIRLPHKISGFSGVSNSSLEVDVQGNIWLGSNRGAYRFSPKKGSPDTLTTLHWQAKDGLVSDVIYDIGIDSVQGMIWFGHDIGVTRYTRNDLRKADAFMTDDSPRKTIAYPNPFKPKVHGIMIIDYVAEDARVQIFNAGGALVRSFVKEDLLGGKLEWDGTDSKGRLVAPGVYHYLVKKGSKVEKGKLLIIH